MDTPINAIIIDDELIACDNLKRILENFIKQPVHILGIANDTSEAELLIKQTRPDLIFLDIEMPDENGLHFLERIVPFDFEVIFTTAYDSFAVKAFRLNVLDYILKPIEIDELESALGKAKQKIDYKNFLLANLNIKKELSGPTAIDDINKLFLRNGNNVEIVEIASIIYIAANLSYTNIFFIRNEQVKHITMSNSIAKYETLMPPDRFYRIHKSYIINIFYIDRIIKSPGASLLLKHNIKLPIGRRRYSGLLSFLETIQKDV
jgi:two-component system LytT family response regulator